MVYSYCVLMIFPLYQAYRFHLENGDVAVKGGLECTLFQHFSQG